MNKAELLEENTRLRDKLHRPERSRLTQRHADLLRENREMRQELASYDGPAAAARRPRQVKRKLRASRILRRLTWERPEKP